VVVYQLGSGTGRNGYLRPLQVPLEQLLAVERICTRIATDLHDDIGSSLTLVAILSEVVRQRIGESDPEVNGPLSRIASVSRELVDSMSDIVWAISPAKDRLCYLEQRMREFASDVFTGSDIHFQFHASEGEHDLPIGADVRREVFLIFHVFSPRASTPEPLAMPRRAPLCAPRSLHSCE
jgi:signal transduction histidine kinase